MKLPLRTNALDVGNDLLDRPTGQLLDAFGAGKASPGSGSAAALMGLLAAKLIRTVCHKSLEKTRDRNTELTLLHILDDLGESESALRALFEKGCPRVRRDRPAADGTRRGDRSRREKHALATRQ